MAYLPNHTTYETGIAIKQQDESKYKELTEKWKQIFRKNTEHS